MVDLEKTVEQAEALTLVMNVLAFRRMLSDAKLSSIDGDGFKNPGMEFPSCCGQRTIRTIVCPFLGQTMGTLSNL
jgi:hypothetical protein